MNINDLTFKNDWTPYDRYEQFVNIPITNRFYTTSWDNRWLYTPTITFDTLTASWPNEYKIASPELEDGADIVPADLKEVL